MLFIKIKFYIILLILVNGCGFNDNKFTKIKNIEKIVIKTPNTKFNLILKKHLKRSFNSYSKLEIPTRFILESRISFTSGDTLSSSGLNELKSTKATVKYSLIDFKSGNLIKTGSIITFPALSSSSSSLYSNDISLEHIKERLSLSSSKKLYMHIKLILQKLN